jgi:hypothetical protein
MRRVSELNTKEILMMDIEQEVLNKVAKILFVGTLIVVLVATASYIGMKQWFWHQVDQEVTYQMERLTHASFGDIVSRSEARVVGVGLWSAKIDIVAFRLGEKSITVYVNVAVRGEDTSGHSFHSHVSTSDGIDTSWSPWVKNSDSLK